KLGLGFAVDDLEIEPNLTANPGAKLFPVRCRTASLGCNQTGAGRAAVAHLVAADRQRLDGAPDRRIAESARGRQPFAEPDDARERIDDAKAFTNRTRDQQATVVGAEVECRIGRPRLITASAAVLARMAGWPATTPRQPIARLPMRRVEAGRSPGLIVHPNTVLPGRS